LWSSVLGRAQDAVTQQSYRTWLEGTDAVGISGTDLIVEGPSQFHVEWVEDKFGMLLTELTGQVVGRPLKLVFRASDERLQLAIPELEFAPAQLREAEELKPTLDPEQARRNAHLNDRYSFDRFVVGGNNELAAAACNAVAEQPGRMYNPLFLYGGVGLGKTHLMHAIGNAILEKHPTVNVCYVSSEQFTNDLVTSIQEGTAPAFRHRYRRVDLLLVDDVHFLQGKERTQEEFFHTFNALHDARKQIVVTSDRPPKELPGLEDRLISRFEWGLVADLKPPDYETRVAILQKKAEYDRLSLDPEVIDFVARSCTSSVRELEGAIIKLLAYSSITHREIDAALARTALHGMISRTQRSGMSPARIRSAVAAQWDVSPEALESKRRTRDVTVPRQVAMYLIKEILDLPLTRIGREFGGRDHSTVIHSIRKVEQELKTEPQLAADVERLRSELSREP